MKCIAAIVLVALFGLALAKPLETEPLEAAAVQGSPVEAVEAAAEAARNKRGVLLGAAYTAPVAYAPYTAPVAYTSAAYSYPYAYSAYSAYPYYAAAAAAYTSPYILP